MISEAGLPPKVQVNYDESLDVYVRSRLRQHTQDTYAGLTMSKFPEDLRVYEHLLWMSGANVVIELGVQFGGSSLWFRDRLVALGRYRIQPAPLVIGVDVDLSHAREHLPAVDPGYATDIKLIEGSVMDPDLAICVADMLPEAARCLVVEDTAHTAESTSAALRGFARFVPPGGFFVVEDGCVDVARLRVAEDWPRGVTSAIRAWLERDGAAFTVRSDLELYGVTCHPGGFLQRTA